MIHFIFSNPNDSPNNQILFIGAHHHTWNHDDHDAGLGRRDIGHVRIT